MQNYTKLPRIGSLMDASRIHQDITNLLYRVEDQYSRIIQHKDQASLLDVDLILKDVRELYECFLDLRAISEVQRRKSSDGAAAAVTAKPVNEVLSEPTVEPSAKESAAEKRVPVIEESSVPEPVLAQEPKPAADKPVAKEPRKEDVVNPQKETSPIAWQKTFDASQARPDEVEKVRPAASTGSAAPAPAAPAANPPVPPQVTAPKVDLLKEREKDFVPTVRTVGFKPEPTPAQAKKESIFDKAASLYDKIAKPGDKPLPGQPHKQPISNIRSSIGINEKFTYLKDLFRNNINDYNEALDKLNNFENYADAEDYFQELKSRYNWDPEGKSFQGLAELLNRRYLHNV